MDPTALQKIIGPTPSCSLLFTLPSFSPSRLIGKADHLGLDLAHLLQIFPYVFHLLLLPGLDECHFFLGVIELDVGVHIQGDGNVAVPHQVLECLGTDPGEGHIGAVGMATNMGRNPGEADIYRCCCVSAR